VIRARVRPPSDEEVGAGANALKQLFLKRSRTESAPVQKTSNRGSPIWRI